MTSREIKALYDRGKRYVAYVCVAYVFVALILEPLHILPKDSILAAAGIGILIALELIVSVDDSIKSLQLAPVGVSESEGSRRCSNFPDAGIG
jgi:hypothetical protein